MLRAIGGLWSTGDGTLERCRLQECFFAPQAPYLCVGTLRDNIKYPNCAKEKVHGEGSQIKKILSSVNIGYLVERYGLDTEVNWDDVLSGGEKQRLGFSRLLLRSDVRFAIL